MVKKTSLIVIIAGVLLVSSLGSAGKWPWQRRIGRDIWIRHKLQHQRVTLDMWPQEPSVDTPVDEQRFEAALGQLCGPMPKDRLTKYVDSVLKYASLFEIDPFLLGALIYDQSHCIPKTPNSEVRYGLTRIDIKMHAPHIRKRKYGYFILKNEQWEEQFLELSEFPFNKYKAAKIRSNIYFAAAFLRVFKEQHKSLDIAFPNKPHRHYVSHWFFGDNVKEIEPEDRVLTARRVLVDYYEQQTPVAAGEFNGQPLLSPLLGVPRLVLDDFGNKRGKKWGPGHQGVDLVGATGEPIYAMADGRIVFAGIELPNKKGSKQMPFKEVNSYKGKLGNAGKYVAINHGKGFRTYYMHMDTILVNDWDMVKAGDIIGTVGKSGSASSGAHLHLEFRVAKKRVDPALFMKNILIDPKRIKAEKSTLLAQPEPAPGSQGTAGGLSKDKP